MALIFNPTDKEIVITVDSRPVVLPAKAKREFDAGLSKFIADFYKDVGLVELSYEHLEHQDFLIKKEFEGLRNQIAGLKQKIDSFYKEIKLQERFDGVASTYKPEHVELAEEELKELEKAFSDKRKNPKKPVAEKVEPNTCELCGFKAKSELGLRAHKTSHKTLNIDEPNNDNSEDQE